MNIPNFSAWLISHSACASGLAWVGQKDFAAVWATCERPDWLLWILHHEGSIARADIVQIATTTIVGLDATHKPALLQHLNVYAESTDPQVAPMVLNESLANRGDFGNLGAAAGIIRKLVNF